MELNVEELKSINVQNLLFPSNYDIELIKEDLPLRILYGNNGSGKTTLLTLIFLLLNKKYEEASKFKFSSIGFMFKNEIQIIFEKSPEEELICKIIKNKKVLSSSKLEFTKMDIDTDNLHLLSSEELRIRLKEELVSSNEWVSRDNDDDFPFLSVNTNKWIRDSEAALEYLRSGKKITKGAFNPPIEDYVIKLKCSFIQTNRLVSTKNLPSLTPSRRSRILRRRRTPHPSEQSPLRMIQKTLRFLIDEATDKSASTGRTFDREFFDLLLKQVKSMEKTELDVLEDQLLKIDTLEQELIELGLYETDTLIESERAKKILKEDEKTISKMEDALIVFSQGLREKLIVYDDLKENTQLFKNYLNNHLQNKSLVISRDSGFKFDILNGPTVNPWNLSSGEQHIVLLAFFLIFLAPDNSLILIDEPEISLNVNWQRNFIKDILELTKKKKINFLLATHSPTIIGEFTAQLYGLDSN